MKGIGGRNNMEEWKEYTIDSICKNIFAGGDASKYCHTAEKTNENNIPIYANSVEKEGLYGYCNKPVVKEKAITIAARGAGTGFVSYRKEPFVPIVRLITLIPQEEVDILFLYYMLKYKKITGDGSAIPQLTIPMIKKEVVSLPSIEEQSRISTILSSLDDKIELNNRINANLEEQAQALFHHWFVENKNKKWTYVDLGSVVKTTSGGTPSRSNLSYYENGTVKWLKSKELKGTYITQTEEKITQYAVENSSAKLLPQNSVLIAMYGATVGEYAIIAEKMTCNQAICALLPNENYPCFYLFMLAKNKKEELVNLAVGSAQQNISQVSIKQVQVPTCKELIRKYDKLVAPYFEKILNNIKQNQSLCQLRDTLLPKLMNGEIEILEEII